MSTVYCADSIEFIFIQSVLNWIDAIKLRMDFFIRHIDRIEASKKYHDISVYISGSWVRKREGLNHCQKVLIFKDVPLMSV